MTSKVNAANGKQHYAEVISQHLRKARDYLYAVRFYGTCATASIIRIERLDCSNEVASAR